MTVRMAVLLAVGGLLVVPGQAGASCAARKPVEQLRQANVAFVGRLVDRSYAQMTFAVEEKIKGSLGARVKVRDDAFMTSAGFGAAVGKRIGLVLRVKNGAFVANDCDIVDIRALRAANRRGEKPCPFLAFPTVRVLSLENLTARIEIRASIAEGRLLTAVVRWGDGRKRTLKLKGRAGRRRLTHQYKTQGLYKGSVRITGRPAIECGDFVESRPTIMQLRFK